MARFFDNLVAYRKQLDDIVLPQPALEALSIRGTVAPSTRPAFADMLVRIIRNMFFSLHGIFIKHRCKTQSSFRQ